MMPNITELEKITAHSDLALALSLTSKVQRLLWHNDLDSAMAKIRNVLEELIKSI